MCSKRDFNDNKHWVVYSAEKIDAIKSCACSTLLQTKTKKLLIKGCLVYCYQVLLQNKMVVCDRNCKSFP